MNFTDLQDTELTEESQQESTTSSNSITSSSSSNSLNSELPFDIAQTSRDRPVQPCLNFPYTTFGGKKRCFNKEWYERYKWIEYSRERNAIFCFPCRFFSLGLGSGRSAIKDAFTRKGFQDWKHALGKVGMLPKHDASSTHKEAVLSWYDFIKNAKQGTSVAHRIDSTRKHQIETNRYYLKTLAEIVLLCARQGIGLRGHRESESSNSSNKGNFLEILHLVSSHDEVVREKLRKGPKNSIYIAPAIQNTLLTIMGSMVRKSVCDGARDAEFFSILADETKDLSKIEQLSIALRYVDSTGSIQEHFLTYVAVSDLTAEGLTTYILEALSEFNLDPQRIVSQSYDGAAVMSGHCTGVQQRVREVVPHAIYIHCHAHLLNLVLVDSVKMVPCAAEFFSIIQSIYVFISTTKAHHIFLQQQKVLHNDRKTLQLQRLSDTRWVCRFAAVNAICLTFDSVLATLQEIREGTDSVKAVEATGLYHQVATFSFIVSLVTFYKILQCTKNLSDQLQSSSIDLACAADLVLTTKTTLEEYRKVKAFGQKCFSMLRVLQYITIYMYYLHQEDREDSPHVFQMQ